MAKRTAKGNEDDAKAAPRRSARDSSVKSTNESLKLAETTAKAKDSRKRNTDGAKATNNEKEERNAKKQKKSGKDKASAKEEQTNSETDELSDVEDTTQKASSKNTRKSGSRASKRESGKSDTEDTKGKQSSLVEPEEKVVAIPNVVLQDEDGNDTNLHDISKKRTIILFAYPKASTPGCTKQAKEYAAAYDENFAKEDGPAVYGISADSTKAQKTFKEKNGLQYHLISDPSHKVIKALGASKGTGSVTRSFFVLKDGEVKHASIKVSPNSTADAVKELLALK